MSISRSTVLNQLPPLLKPKTGGTREKSEPELLDQSGGYLAAHAESPVGAQIAAEATTLKTSRDALLARDNELTLIKATYDSKVLDLVKAWDDHANAIDTYARRAVIIAKGDRAVLQGLGVEFISLQRGPRAKGPAGTPTNVRVAPGEDSGSVNVKWARPRGAGAFLAQYKLEPLSADAPPSDWFPAEGFATKNVEWLIDNLQPIAQVRVRVRAIGAEIGPWSEEALGRAR
jgi:hypothetical protein